jgi:hypothetical protein
MVIANLLAALKATSASSPSYIPALASSKQRHIGWHSRVLHVRSGGWHNCSVRLQNTGDHLLRQSMQFHIHDRRLRIVAHHTGWPGVLLVPLPTTVRSAQKDGQSCITLCLARIRTDHGKGHPGEPPEGGDCLAGFIARTRSKDL